MIKYSSRSQSLWCNQSDSSVQYLIYYIDLYNIIIFASWTASFPSHSVVVELSKINIYSKFKLKCHTHFQRAAKLIHASNLAIHVSFIFNEIAISILDIDCLHANPYADLVLWSLQ